MQNYFNVYAKRHYRKMKSHSIICGNMTKELTLLNSNQLAEMLGVKPITVYHWRVQNKGPVYIRLAKRLIRYRLEDIQSWLKEHQEEKMGAAQVT